MPTLSSYAKERLCIHAVNIVLIVLVGTEAFLWPHLVLGHMFFIGSLLLATLLIVPRLRTMAILHRWHEPLLKIARHSKWLGIWTATWFWLYAVLALIWERSVTSYLQGIVGGLVLGILTVLIALSNTGSYQHVKLWKHINMTVWMLPSLLLSYLTLTALTLNGFERDLTYGALLLTILFGMLGIWVHRPDYFARFRLVLIAIATFIGGLCVFLHMLSF